MGEDRTSRPGPSDQPTGRRLTVSQAAAELGISEDAIRSRIKRGTLETKRDGGRVFVVLGETAQTRPGRDRPSDRPDESNALISQLRDENAYLREENRRKDEIIMQQAISMRQLSAGTQPSEATESPREARESPASAGPTDTAPDAPERPHAATEAPDQRSWWRRVFGG